MSGRDGQPPTADFHPAPVGDGPTLAPLALSRVRVPIPGRSPIDDAAAAADARRTIAARQRLAARFDPIDPLLGDPPATTEPVQVVAAVSLITAVEATELIDRLLVHEDNRPPRLGVILGNDPAVDPHVGFRTVYDLYRPHVAAISDKLVTGAGLAVTGIEGYHRGLRDLTADLDQLLGPGTTADLIMVGESTDVPLSASPVRSWLIMPLADPVQIHAGVDREPSTIAPGAAGVLDGPGTVSADGSTLLVRIALPRPSWADVVNVLVERARSHPLLRADLPTDLSAPVTSYAGSLFDAPDALTRAVGELVDDDLLWQVEGRSRLSARQPPATDLADALALVTGERRPVRFTTRPVIADAGAGGEVRLVIGTQTIDGPDDLIHRLAAVHDGTWWDPATVLDRVGSSQSAIRRWLGFLLSSGAIDVGPVGSEASP